MRNFTKTVIGGAGAVALAVVAAGGASASHTWNNYHWARTANPVPLEVVDSVSSFWQQEFTIALGEWNQSSVLNMQVTAADDSSKTRRLCKMVAGKMRVCNQSYGNNGWLGLATIGLDAQGHIDQGSAQMNDTYSSYWTDPNEKRHVMCQEIGHVFGLGHTSEDGSSQNTCMDYSQSPTSISPNQHDYDLLASQYAHLDSYNSYVTGGGGGTCQGKNCPKGAADAPNGVPAGAIRVHGDKFEEIWVKGRADGGHWVFHVRLAPKNGK